MYLFPCVRPNVIDADELEPDSMSKDDNDDANDDDVDDDAPTSRHLIFIIVLNAHVHG